MAQNAPKAANAIGVIFGMVRENMGLSSSEMARRLGVSERDVLDQESGNVAPAPVYGERLFEEATRWAKYGY